VLRFNARTVDWARGKVQVSLDSFVMNINRLVCFSTFFLRNLSRITARSLGWAGTCVWVAVFDLSEMIGAMLDDKISA
jgi:hypothetical protein